MRRRLTDLEAGLLAAVAVLASVDVLAIAAILLG